MKKILYGIFALSLIIMSCDLSDLFKQDKGSPTKVGDFGISLVRFYKDSNSNMQTAGLYNDVEYVDATMIGNQIQARLKYQTFVKNGERNMSIVPRIYYTGDSISPRDNEKITQTYTSYTVTRGNETKEYELVIIIEESSIPFSYNVALNGIPLEYIDVNVWGFVGLPWDIAGFSGNDQEISIEWDGDIDFPDRISLPSRTSFQKNGQEYFFELTLSPTPINYPISATQNGKTIYADDNHNIYILPNPDGNIEIEIQYVPDVTIQNINKGEFDVGKKSTTADNTIDFIKNDEITIDYNNKSILGSFTIVLDGEELTYTIINQKYNGNTITFETEDGYMIYPKSKNVVITFLKYKDNYKYARYIPAGTINMTIETAKNFTINIDNDDTTQFYEGREKRGWQQLGKKWNNEYEVNYSAERYEKEVLQDIRISSYTTLESNTESDTRTYSFDVANIEKGETVEVLRFTEVYKDILEHEYDTHWLEDGGGLWGTNPDCGISYTSGKCTGKKIPSKGAVWNKSPFSHRGFHRVSDTKYATDPTTFTFSKSVETIIYYTKP